MLFTGTAGPTHGCGPTSITWALVSLYALASIDDDLAKERFTRRNPAPIACRSEFVRLIALAHLIVGALDSGRLHLTTVPPGLRVVGFIGMAASCFVVFHAMLSNRFFSAVVRIQRDRGHRVDRRWTISCGPAPGLCRNDPGGAVQRPRAGLVD